MRSLLYKPGKDGQECAWSSISSVEQNKDNQIAGIVCQRVTDLGLAEVFKAGSQGDARLSDIFERLILAGCDDVETIDYRQTIMRDALQSPELFRRIYSHVSETVQTIRKEKLSLFTSDYGDTLARDGRMLQYAEEGLRRIREDLIEVDATTIRSEGMSMLRMEFLSTFTQAYLENLREASVSLTIAPFRMSADVMLDDELNLRAYDVAVPEKERGILRGIFARRTTMNYEVPPNDISERQELKSLQNALSAKAAAAANQLYSSVISYLLRIEEGMAFYVGFLNLRDELLKLGCVMCIPVCGNYVGWKAQELYDPGLALRERICPVANTIDSLDSELMMITGANQGGKTTFLRSFGSAMVLMTCGGLVPASALTARPWRKVFTHFESDEDDSMHHGKLDEELMHIEAIVDCIKPGDGLLLNEAFSSTNERECAQISIEIIDALLSKDINVCVVTHCFELAAHYFNTGESRNDEFHKPVMFLSPSRQDDGTRTFLLTPQKPENRAFAEESYNKIFASIDC